MAQGFIATTQAELEQERAVRVKMGPMAAVYVVNKPLNYGDPLTKDDVQKIYWPANALPETVFQDEALLFPEGETRPRYMNRQIEAFEPLLASRVTEPGGAGRAGGLQGGCGPSPSASMRRPGCRASCSRAAMST
ncbi:SAF domain-containing protein [Cereibacter changlensis]|uniref:SAF domain-containing protein n=1 Tax=Cereibacter changlensis TaxID=402884 RepID=UPI0040343CD5